MKIGMIGVKSVPCSGGIAKYTEELGRRLAARGHHVTVYCRQQYLDDPACSVHAGIHRCKTPGLSGKHLDAPSHTFTAACDAIARDFDVLHIHGLAPGFVVPLLRATTRKRIVLTAHACDWQGSKWSAVARACMYQASSVGLRLAHRVTAVSRGLQEYLRQERGCNATYAPPGIPVSSIAAPSDILQRRIEPGSYVLCVSRLMPEKGVHYAVAAFERLQTDKKLVIAGDCPYECEYVKELLSHASDKIIFLGYVSGRTLAELYSHAYLFLQPSDLEGLSISVLEALSYGRCVLASDIPQNQEALGGHGYTFEAGRVESLTEKLQWLLERPDVVEAQFARVREYVRQCYDWERTTDIYEQVYQSCFENAERARALPGPAR
ncbi:MAG: glycosyltransferase family 4 protein [Armatimonadetes bacterium]|nr:glycosyltransferase family 4 protein [Armatimonadota bacterium]